MSGEWRQNDVKRLWENTYYATFNNLKLIKKQTHTHRMNIHSLSCALWQTMQSPCEIPNIIIKNNNISQSHIIPSFVFIFICVARRLNWAAAGAFFAPHTHTHTHFQWVCDANRVQLKRRTLPVPLLQSAGIYELQSTPMKVHTQTHILSYMCTLRCTWSTRFPVFIFSYTKKIIQNEWASWSAIVMLGWFMCGNGDGEKRIGFRFKHIICTTKMVFYQLKAIETRIIIQH